MNGSGITPFNSGPLLLRTYQDGSSNNTYVVQQYDLPVSTNRALVTSLDGLLSPSDTMYLSSFAVSSLRGNTTTISTTFESYRSTTSSIISTATINSTTYGKMTGSSIYTNNVIASTSVFVPSTSTTNLVYANLSGGPGSFVKVDNLLGNFTLTSGTFAATAFGNITFVNMSGVGNEVSNLYSTNYVKTGSVYTVTCANPIMSSVTDNINTLSTNFLSTINTVGNILSTDTLYASTTNASSINTINATITTLNRPAILCTMNVKDITGTTILCSTLTGSTVTYSTLTGSTTNTDKLYLNTGMFSTLRGSTVYVSSLFTSTIFLSSFLGSTMTFSTFIGSSMYGSTLTINGLSTVQFTTDLMMISTLSSGTGNNANLFASTNTISTIMGCTMNFSYMDIAALQASSLSTTSTLYNTLQGSTLASRWLYMSQPANGISSLLGSTVTTSTLIASTIQPSSLLGSTLSVSTLWGSSITGTLLTLSTAFIGTFYGSSVTYTGITISTMNATTLTATTLNYSTVIISSMILSSVLTSTFNGMNVSTTNSITNTALGCSSLIMTTGTNDTAVGYGALSSLTTGSYQTAVGYEALSYDTTGSCQTGIGAFAGSIPGHSGSYGTYIGYEAVPSVVNVNNEIVLGGSNTVSVPNTGSGASNTIVVGNPAITKTVLYQTVGIGTNAPQAALDLRGSYQQIGGNQSITNSNPASYSYYYVYNDLASGAGVYLNGASRALDGGPTTATLRNDNGHVFLQAQGGSAAMGITVLAGGNVGINSAAPVQSLDVNGSLSATSTLQVSSVIVTGTLQGNSNTVSQTTQWSGTSPIYYTLGNVGIGTKTPTKTLDVYGSGYVSGALTLTSVYASSITSGAIDTRGNSVYMSTITSGAITCSTIDAQAGTITCGNLITSTIGGKVIPTAFPPSGVTFDNNMGIGFGNWFMTGYYTTYDTTANVPAAFSIRYTPSGNGVSLSTFSFTWSSYSDRRIKQGIRGIGAVLRRFLQLRPVNYYLKADRSRGRLSGFIAQEVQRVLPLLVNDSTINPDNAFESNLLGIQPTLFMPYLFKVLQEQHAIVKKHAEQIQERKGMIQQMKDRIQHVKQRIDAIRSAAK